MIAIWNVFLFMCMPVFVCMRPCMQALMELWTPWCASWKPKSSALQKQQVFWTDGPSPQPQISVVKSLFKWKHCCRPCCFSIRENQLRIFLSVTSCFPHTSSFPWLFLSLDLFGKECIHFLVCMSVFDCMYVCIPWACLVPCEAREGQRISWDWSYRWLWATTWFLEIKLKLSKRAPSAPKPEAYTQFLFRPFFFFVITSISQFLILLWAHASDLLE